MRYQIRIKPKARKQLDRIPEYDRVRVLASLAVISNNPYIGKKLKGDFKGLYSYRVWPYRILYKIIQRKLLIVVIRIGHRQEVYS